MKEEKNKMLSLLYCTICQKPIYKGKWKVTADYEITFYCKCGSTLNRKFRQTKGDK
jgi:hypothetical protein